MDPPVKPEGDGFRKAAVCHGHQSQPGQIHKMVYIKTMAQAQSRRAPSGQSSRRAGTMAPTVNGVMPEGSDPERLARVGLKSFFRLARLWHLKAEEERVLLGNPARSTFYNWKRGQVRTVPEDTLRRLGYIFGIHKALRVLFSNPAQTYGWISKPNTAFGGQSALDRMLAGDVTDLAHVRQYLDSVRGGWT